MQIFSTLRCHLLLTTVKTAFALFFSKENLHLWQKDFFLMQIIRRNPLSIPKNSMFLTDNSDYRKEITITNIKII